MAESNIIGAIPMTPAEEGWGSIRDRGIDDVYPSRYTALGFAASYEREENVSFLRQEGANPNSGIRPPYDAGIPAFMLLLMV